jgi:hypothetical protein
LFLANDYNYYQAPFTNNQPLNETYVSTLVNTFVVNEQQQQTTAEEFLILDQTLPAYISNDRIWTLYTVDLANNVYLLSPFTIPRQIGTNCLDSPTVYYLNDAYSNCIRTTTDVSNVCTSPSTNTASSLAASSYSNSNFAFLKNPQSLFNCFNNSATQTQPFNYASCGTNYLVPITPRLCTFSGTAQAICPTTLPAPVVTGGFCTNLVKKATYTIVYSNPTGITNVYLDLEFTQQASTSTYTSVDQAIQVVFVPNTYTLVIIIIIFILCFKFFY